MIISTWEIKYPNAIQVKNLIDHRDYISIIKPIQSLIHEYQSIADDKKTSISEKKRLESLISGIKSRLQEYTGEHWFTTESPLYLAFNTSILKLNHAEIKFEFREIVES